MHAVVSEQPAATIKSNVHRRTRHALFDRKRKLHTPDAIQHGVQGVNGLLSVCPYSVTASGRDPELTVTNDLEPDKPCIDLEYTGSVTQL